MLGPALTLLFAELDKRKSKLTAYEKALHQELLAAKSGGPSKPPASKTAGAGKRGTRGGSNRPISLPADVGGPMPGIGSKRRGAGANPGPGNFSFSVDLSTGGGIPQLQIGCKRVDCPNKKRT
jgi:hypothetical protein